MMYSGMRKRLLNCILNKIFVVKILIEALQLYRICRFFRFHCFDYGFRERMKWVEYRNYIHIWNMYDICPSSRCEIQNSPFLLLKSEKYAQHFEIISLMWNLMHVSKYMLPFLLFSSANNKEFIDLCKRWAYNIVKTRDAL